MVRKNLYFPQQLIERIKRHCAFTGESMAAVVRRSVDEFLKKAEATDRAKQRSEK